MKKRVKLLSKKYLDGKIDSCETKELLGNLHDEEMRAEFTESSQSWIGHGELVDENWNELSLKIQRSANLDQHTFIKKKWLQTIRYAAAIIIAFVVGGGGVWHVQNNLFEELLEKSCVIETPKGERSSIILSDGTKVWLNSGSQLIYSHSFGVENRKVTLKGEGFFEVTKDKMPFIVNTSYADVRVFGTRFNVSAYDDDGFVEATLEEGSIGFQSETNKEIIKIEPGQQILLVKDKGEIIVKRVNVDLYTSWKEQKLKFDNASFADVIKKLERWYDVDIMWEEELMSSERYTMTFKTESLREVFELIQLTTPMIFNIDKDKVFITNPKPLN